MAACFLLILFKKTGPFASTPSKAQQKRELLAHLERSKHVECVEKQNLQNCAVVETHVMPPDLESNVQKCINFLKSQGYIVTKPTFYNIQLHLFLSFFLKKQNKFCF